MTGAKEPYGASEPDSGWLEPCFRRMKQVPNEKWPEN